MSFYLDASVLVAFFTIDASTPRADAFLREALPELIVSDFATAEFASAVARRVRMRELTPKEARSAFVTFDSWAARVTRRAETGAADVALATTFLRRLDLNLRTADAINIAIAQRVDAELATFDARMADCAKALNLPTKNL